MILDELVLDNVGTFRGKHKMTLTPPSPRQPVVLVGGLNGAGKTTVLQAIHLALYGALAQPSGRRGGSYESYLRSLIHHGVPGSDGAAVELTFRAHREGEEHTYRIRRRWRETGASSFREFVLVSVDGRHDEALTTGWNEHVETFLPRGTAGLFFFDGEQIEALADMDRSRQVLSSALAALLGLDLIDRLNTDLAVLRRRRRSAEVPDELRQAVEERRQAVTAIRQEEEAAADELAKARVEAERADKRLHELREQYRAAGGGLLEQRDAAETRASLLRDQLQETDDQLRREMSDIAPLLLVTTLFDGVTEQAVLERDANRDLVVLRVVAGRDQTLIDRLRTARVDSSTISAVEEFLAKDRTAWQAASDVPRITGMRDPGQLEPLRSALPTARRRLKSLAERHHALRTDLDQAERTLVAIPDQEALAPLSVELEQASNEAANLTTSLQRAEDRLSMHRQERARADAAYEAALDRAAHASLTADDDRRLVEHINRVRATLDALKVAASERHLDRISDLILEALTRLLRKEKLISAVRIDPESHTVELAGAGGRELAAAELSAGERQLLAVALLWGLARAAGQPLPMVIDTPLGRLDRSHRGHLIERYFPHASHQVVLLSTDTEIDADAYRTLHPYVGRAYRLEFDPSRNASTVEVGYFWE